ncbi:endolytic transglycosylase MltG [Novispirillum itersonii subsp. nipponicum]
MVAVFLVILLVGAGSAAGLWQWAKSRYTSPGQRLDNTVVLIPKGAGITVIVDILSRAGVLRDQAERTLIPLFARLDGQASSLRAGEYAIPPDYSLADVVAMLASGRNQVQYTLTIPEGLTVQEALEKVRALEVLEGDITVTPNEGDLMPETYQLLRGDNRTTVVRRMMTAQATLLTDLWERRVAGLPLKSPREALTLASVVEKETGVAAERRRVAGVFINRLRLGMPLQSDPTVIYGLARNTGSLGRALTRKDLETDHAWNTYTRPGLPAGPIALPGRLALEAVLNPDVSKDLYFVADGTGGHAFAETLDEHNRNVAHWRKLQKN